MSPKVESIEQNEQVFNVPRLFFFYQGNNQVLWTRSAIDQVLTGRLTNTFTKKKVQCLGRQDHDWISPLPQRNYEIGKNLRFSVHTQLGVNFQKTLVRVYHCFESFMACSTMYRQWHVNVQLVQVQPGVRTLCLIDIRNIVLYFSLVRAGTLFCFNLILLVDAAHFSTIYRRNTRTI